MTCEGCLPLPHAQTVSTGCPGHFLEDSSNPIPLSLQNGSAAPTAERRDAGILNRASAGGPLRSSLVSGSWLVVTSGHGTARLTDRPVGCLLDPDEHGQHLTGLFFPLDMHI